MPGRVGAADVSYMATPGFRPAPTFQRLRGSQMAEPTTLRGAVSGHGAQTPGLTEKMRVYAPAAAARDRRFVAATWPRADGSGSVRAVSW
jgi:hypothetical protein